MGLTSLPTLGLGQRPATTDSNSATSTTITSNSGTPTNTTSTPNNTSTSSVPTNSSNVSSNTNTSNIGSQSATSNDSNDLLSQFMARMASIALIYVSMFFIYIHEIVLIYRGRSEFINPFQSFTLNKPIGN